MPIIPQAEQNQVVSIDGFTALRRQNIEMIFIFSRCELRIDFTAQASNRFFRNSSRHKKSLLGHSEVALRLIRRDATFVAESDSTQLPRLTIRDPSDLTAS